MVTRPEAFWAHFLFAEPEAPSGEITLKIASYSWPFDWLPQRRQRFWAGAAWNFTSTPTRLIVAVWGDFTILVSFYQSW
eukprot:s1049_g17.t1